MSRAKINLILDTVLLLCMGAMGGIGFLIRYVLVPGWQRWEIYGRNVDLLFLGMDRHEWGAIHFVVGCVFLGLLVLHIVLHWGAIVGVFRKLIPSPVARVVVATVLVALMVLLTASPFFIKPEVRDGGRGGGHRYRGGRHQTEPTVRPER